MKDHKSRDAIHSDLTDHVDESKRKVITALLTGAAFAAPLMVSFEKGAMKFASTANAKKAKKKKASKK